jgi:hypothetical protein
MKFTAQWGKAPSNSRDEALELVEDGYVSAEDMLVMALKYMSTDDVADMLDCNELSERFDEAYEKTLELG